MKYRGNERFNIFNLTVTAIENNDIYTRSLNCLFFLYRKTGEIKMTESCTDCFVYKHCYINKYNVLFDWSGAYGGYLIECN